MARLLVSLVLAVMAVSATSEPTKKVAVEKAHEPEAHPAAPAAAPAGAGLRKQAGAKQETLAPLPPPVPTKKPGMAPVQAVEAFAAKKAQQQPADKPVIPLPLQKPFFLGLPKVFWAVVADALAMLAFIACIPTILSFAKRRRPAALPAGAP